jgi:hypothetical protein
MIVMMEGVFVAVREFLVRTSPVFGFLENIFFWLTTSGGQI